MHDRHHDIALFRYSLVRQAADAALSTRQRGRLVRDLAGGEHATPWGERVVVSRNTLDRWIRAYRTGGFEALVPRSRQAEPTTPASVLGLAEALRREDPQRTAAHVAAIIAEANGWGPPSASLRPVGSEPARSRASPSVWAFRGGRPQRAVDRRRAPRPRDRRAQGVSVRLCR
jgi:putative transposase